ncbi:ParB N-terminal domain-containing protein [Streptomyces sp. NPDC089919]|uniref:ParB N-terminal domain-containing protein n=1 Tax=Streptomyces sp. NPDC089919 TaxID=3155188 RepID=UPI00342373F4
MRNLEQAEGTDTGNPDHLIALRDKALREFPVEWVPIDDLTVSSTPRVEGEDPAYARSLAEAEAVLPPILVHRATMQVLDGVHRLRAARLQGRDCVEVRFFDGTEAESFPLAVAVNVAQGRPLSSADRTAAVTRILASHPHWSDRGVAAIVGLSPQKVGHIRRRTLDPARQAPTRLGRDGRARPLNSARARTLAGELIRANPAASLRQIGQQAGLSPATVADVRARLERGEDVVPPQQRGPAAVPPAEHRRAPAPAPRAADTVPKSTGQLLALYDNLRRDPSLRFNDSGRALLRMLEVCALVARDRQRIASTVPHHCKGPVSELVHGFADVWAGLAEQLAGTELLETRSV